MNCAQGTPMGFEDVFGFVIAPFNLLLVLLVLLISRQIKSNEISRIFTIFLFVSYIPAEVLSLLYDSFRCAGFIDSRATFFPDAEHSFQHQLFYFVYKLSRTFAQSQYELLALVMAFMSYLLFTNPATFALYFGDSQAVIYLSVISALSLIASVLCVALNVIDEVRGAWILTLLYCAEQATILVPFALMLFFYVTSCIAIHRYSKMTNNVRSDSKYQLISVLLYCTPPNLLNIVVIAICACQLTQFFTHSAHPGFYSQLRTVQWYIEKVRLVFLTICTLLAFSNYRNFVFAKCFRRQQTQVLAISSIQTARPDSAKV